MKQPDQHLDERLIELVGKDLSGMITQLEPREQLVPKSHGEWKEQNRYASTVISIALRKVSIILPEQIQPLVTRLLEQEETIFYRDIKCRNHSLPTDPESAGRDEEQPL